MDVSRPYRAVAPALEGDVLVVLAGTTQPMTGRMVARRIPHASPDGVRKALGRLVTSGLVQRHESDGAHLHWLNREHLAAPAVLQLAGLRTALIERLRRAVGRWNPAPLHASLFGSTARGDGGPDSDIDIFVVRPAMVDPDSSRWPKQVDQLHRQIEAWTGNPVSIIEIGEHDLATFAAHPPPAARELRRDAIDLAGTPMRTLLAAAPA